MAVRTLLGERVDVKPDKGGLHLVAHGAFHPAALPGGAVGADGSGGVSSLSNALDFIDIEMR